MWNQGDVTQAERSLALHCDDYAEPARRAMFGLADEYRLNTEKVNFLASKWSLDPTTLDERVLLKSHGIAGNISL